MLSSSSSSEDSDSSQSSPESEDEGSNKHTVRGRLPEERENAKRSASRAAQVRANAKKGKTKQGPKNRETPIHQDMVDLCDNMTNGLVKNQERTDMLSSLANKVLEQQALQVTTCTNTPKCSPHTRRTKIREEITGKQTIIWNLYQEVKMMEESGREPEHAIQETRDRIERHRKQTIKFEEELAKENEER